MSRNTETPPWAVARLAWARRRARPEQLPPPGDDWLIWLILAGRGWGKTRTGAEELLWSAWRHPRTRWAVVAATSNDVRQVCFRGESGLLGVARRYRLYDDRFYNDTTATLALPNGSIIQGYSADRPDRLRGPQFHGAWADELAAWRYADSWHNLRFATRLGRPKIIVTTTPRPTHLVKDIANDPLARVTSGSTFDNADNLAPEVLAALQEKYAGTRLGRQELCAEILEQNANALWRLDNIDQYRVERIPEPVTRTVVGVDPAVTANEDSDETGIVVAALGQSRHVYITADYSGKMRPEVWAKRIAKLVNYHGVEEVVVEVNQGGDLVRQVLDAGGVDTRITDARAVKGKAARAEPVAMLYEQGKVHHVGTLPQLEDQLTSWNPDSRTSPDRLDALVWAVAGLVRRAPLQPAVAFAT